MSEIVPASPEEFVKKWMEALKKNKGQVWIAEQLGITKQAVYARSYNYRKVGVNLPKLTWRNNYGEVKGRLNELNKIIEES